MYKYLSYIFPLLFLEWTIANVKKWVLETFEDETIAQKFESKEVDGPILLSTTVHNNEVMEALCLTTIGKKGRFLDKTDTLAGKFNFLVTFTVVLSEQYHGHVIFLRAQNSFNFQYV